MKKKSLPKPILFVFVTIIFFTPGCNLDKFDLEKLDSDIQLNHGITAPLIKGSLTMSDLMESVDSTDFLGEDSTGLYYFSYGDNLIQKSAEDQLNIPDQDFIHFFVPAEYSIPASLVQEITIEDTINFEFQFSDEARMDSIKADNLTFEHYIRYTYRNSCELTVTYPNLTKNGEPFRDTIAINDNSGSFDTTFSDNLQNYTASLIDPEDPTKSYFPIAYKFVLHDDGYAVEADDELEVDSRIRDIDLNSAYGYLGQDTLLLQESSIDLDFFSNEIEGDIEFAAPELKFFIENSLGIPVEVDIRDVKGFKVGEDDTTYLTFDPGVNPFTINYPELSEIGETKNTTLEISDENSNLPEFIASKPERISFEPFAVSNPEGPTGDENNFVTDNGEFNVDFEVNLPLWFKMDGLEMKDTMDMDLEGSLGDIDIIKELEATLSITNGLPIDLDIQLYFLDENMVMVDSLFTGGDKYLVTGANVDSEGVVTTPNTSSPKISITEDRVDNLQNVKNAIFSVALRTSDYNQDTKVKFYSHYDMKFKMFMKAYTEIKE